jgi:hypothetical protein
MFSGGLSENGGLRFSDSCGYPGFFIHNPAYRLSIQNNIRLLFNTNLSFQGDL